MGDIISYGNISLNKGTMELNCENQVIKLGVKEFRIMEILLSSPRQIISKDMLIEKVWGIDKDVEHNNVEVYISFLRQKFHSLNANVQIKTSRGRVTIWRPNMIKKMRYQFILVTMASISFIFILILSVINISMTMSSRRQGYSLLYRVADMQMQAKAASPAFMPPKSPPVMEMQAEPPTSPALPAALNKFDIFRSFSVLYGDDGELLDIFYDEHSEMDEESIAALADKVMSKQNAETKGNISKYLYLIRNVPGDIQIFFLDYSLEKEISQRLFRTCLWIGFIGIFFIFLLVIFLSRWIVRPVQSAFDSQKQFIADASHELKTPLTIITANAEVLAGSIGGNKWLENIISQSGRIDKLIKSLLDLARLDSHAQFPGLA
ncbi:MAG: winged helix-turn-helix domain-containing protein, partial [Kineothrix sp.]|nr:winged helix-turn-helix domain-containing protein [Kineothrix sp.]